MKKYEIFEILTHILISLIAVIVMINLKNIDNFEYHAFLVFIVITGFVLPLVHVLYILIKQIRIKEYVSKRYNSIGCYGFVFSIGVLYIIVYYVISVEWFYKLHILFWIIPFVIYISLFITFFLLQKKDDKKIPNKIIKNR